MISQEIKQALQDLQQATLKELKAKQPKIVSYDQSASVRCTIHGHHCLAYFVAGGVPAQYVCGVCWNALEN